MPSSSGATGPRRATRSAEARATSRTVAIEAVRRVADDGAYSNLVLPALLDRSGLDARDRDLAAELTYGTLRRMPGLDAALAGLVERPLADAPSRARAALRVGAYQLLFTRIPDHAAVGETVGAVPKSERGFVNAVLRRLSANAGDARASVESVPPIVPWAMDELRRLLGDEAEAAAAALAEPAGLTLRTNPCRAEAGALAAALRDAGHAPEPGRLHVGTVRLAGGRPSELPGYGEGWFAVQDEASSWVVDVLDPQPGERVLDAAAGPGGKAADIACRAGSVVAADAALHRVSLIGATARRLGVRALLLAQDAGRPALSGGF
ncbi:MAG TPA: transcription antitermination factor NusB, partial [Actinomycetota bacterium]